jgi:hypothetical protein
MTEPISFRYIVTDELVEKDGELFFHPDRTWCTHEEPTAGVYSDMWLRPDIFERTLKTGEKVFDVGNFYVGIGGFPSYKYDPDTDTFTYVESWKKQWARHAIRRHAINQELGMRVKLQTELKKIRKAIKAIVAAIPELQELPEVQDYMGLSGFIEGTVGKFEKDTERGERFARKFNEEDDPFWMPRRKHDRQDDGAEPAACGAGESGEAGSGEDSDGAADHHGLGYTDSEDRRQAGAAG